MLEGTIGSGETPDARRARGARLLPARDVGLPVADSRLPLVDRDRRARRHPRDPASRLVRPPRAADRRVRELVRRGACRRHRPDAAGHARQHERAAPRRASGDAVRVARRRRAPHRGRQLHRLPRAHASPLVAAVPRRRLGPERFFFYNLFSSDRTGAPLSWRNRAGGLDRRVRDGRRPLARDARRVRLPPLLSLRLRLRLARARARHALEALQRCDAAIGSLAEAGGGIDALLERYAVVVMSDHGQTRVHEAVSLAEVYAGVDGVLPLASNRAAHVYLQPGCRLDARAVAARLDGVPAVEVALFREGRRPSRGAKARSSSSRRPGGGFSLSGDASILGSSRRASPAPGPRSRTRTRARCSSRPPTGYEFTDLGGGHHVGGGSHGSLVAGDTEVPLLTAWASTGTARAASSTWRRSSSPTSASRRPRTRSTGPPSPSASAATLAGRDRAALDHLRPGRRPASRQRARPAQQLGAAREVLRRRRRPATSSTSSSTRSCSKWAGLHYIPAAIGSFLVAVANNYTLNRVWTFRVERGHVGAQGLRFLVVSTVSLLANLVVLHLLVDGRASARSSRRRSRSCS